MVERIGLLGAIALLAVSVPSSATAQCEVEGVATLDRLRVRVPGQRLRTLSVVDLPVAVRPGRGTRYRDVRVLAPLSFGARTDGAIPWAAREAGELAEGTLHLTPRVAIESVREHTEGEGLVIRAQLDAGVWVDRVHVPCEAMTVGHGEGSTAPPSWGFARGPRWMPYRETFFLTAEPHDGASIRVEAPEGLPRPLVEIERRDGDVRVVAVFSSGAAIRGWMPHRQLRSVRTSVTVAEPWSRTFTPGPLSSCRRRAPQRDEYVGPARLTPGAIVRTHGGGGEAWATVSEPSLVTVSWRPGADWVRIVHVPGLLGDQRCPEVLQVAYVPRRAVTLTGERVTLGSGQPETLLGLE